MKLLRIALETSLAIGLFAAAPYIGAALDSDTDAATRRALVKRQADAAKAARWADLDAAGRAMVAFDRIGRK
jgi:hypothetical protein